LKQELQGLRDIPFQPSTIETIDYSVYDWLKSIMNLFVSTNLGFKEVPIIWSSSERAFFSKNFQDSRDKYGAINYPIISIQRTGMTKTPNRKGSVWSNVPLIDDAKGGSISIARRINQDKTSIFANADTKKHKGQINFPRKNPKVVYETISIPIPVYIDVLYSINIRTLYLQQMNELIQPFITKTGGINYVIFKREGHHFEGFIDQNFMSSGNESKMEDKEKIYETIVKIKVLGYLIGGDKNQEQPKIVVRENAVEIKFPRERIMVGDINEFTNKQGYVGITSTNEFKK